MKAIGAPADLGAAIRARRRILRLTQDDLALSIGINRRVLGQLENGKQTVQLNIALRAAHAVGLELGVQVRGEA